MEKDKEIRLFLGSYIDPEIIYSNFNSPELEQYFNCSLKWVEKENIHLTWKFIGETGFDNVEKIIRIIRDLTESQRDIAIEFNDFAIWPNGKCPRQLVITGLDIEHNGTRLYKDINNSLKKIGIEKEKRAFNPHITVARFRIKNKLEVPLVLPDWLKFDNNLVKFSRLDLIQSVLSPKGSTYKILETFSL